MCDFFSVTSDGLGNIKYFDWEIRKRILSKELDYKADSHTSINDYFGFKGKDEDLRNKYEFNPLTGVFRIDRINSLDDSKEVERKVRELDFSKIVPALIIKPIVHPFKVKPNEVTDIDIENLRTWCLVRASVRASVRALVRDSVCDSVCASVRASVYASVYASVCASVCASAYDPVYDSVYDSVCASVRGYISSFFSIEKWNGVEHEPFVNPYQCLIDLWERGFVPSFDGETYRLHSGEDADIVYEMAA